MHTHLKRIGIEVAKVKEMWEKGEVKTIRWIPGQYQLADDLTKKEASRKLSLDSVYEGNTNIDGDMYCVEDNDDGPGASRTCLDVGLARTSTVAKMFTALKGDVVGGLDIHTPRRESLDMAARPSLSMQTT